MNVVNTVTVAATQFACGAEIAGNVDRAERVVRAAAARGAQIILLPELFETPYFCKDQNVDLFELAQPVEDHPTVARMQQLARDLKVVLPVSIFERANNAHYNSVVVIDADGEQLGCHHLRSVTGAACLLLIIRFLPAVAHTNEYAADSLLPPLSRRASRPARARAAGR